jgi:hypothetical protein
MENQMITKIVSLSHRFRMEENVYPTGTYVWSFEVSVNYLSHVGPIFAKSSKVLALKALGLVTPLLTGRLRVRLPMR